MTKKTLVWLWVIAVLLIASCQGGGKPELGDDPLTDPALEESINDYLVEHIAIIGYGGDAYCAYEMLNAEQGTGAELYLWTLCMEYYFKQGLLTGGSGISLPVALQIEQQNDHIEIIGHLVPQDGNDYGPDVRSIFPKSTWAQIMPQNEDEIDQYNLRANELMEETRRKAGLEELKIED